VIPEENRRTANSSSFLVDGFLKQSHSFTNSMTSGALKLKLDPLLRDCAGNACERDK
jgi:hypothetical protein